MRLVVGYTSSDESASTNNVTGFLGRRTPRDIRPRGACLDAGVCCMGQKALSRGKGLRIRTGILVQALAICRGTRTLLVLAVASPLRKEAMAFLSGAPRGYSYILRG